MGTSDMELFRVRVEDREGVSGDLCLFPRLDHRTHSKQAVLGWLRANLAKNCLSLRG
jgi:hypothetical protein